MKPVFIRTPYNYDMHEASNESALRCMDKSRTAQEFKDEADINTIVKRFGLTGELPENVPMVLQGDFTNVTDFMGAMNLVVAARESFDAQPAEIRARFDNDPHKFLEFTSNKDNLDEAIKMGLVREESITKRAKEVRDARNAEIQAAVEVEMATRARKEQETMLQKGASQKAVT